MNKQVIANIAIRFTCTYLQCYLNTKQNIEPKIVKDKHLYEFIFFSSLSILFLFKNEHKCRKIYQVIQSYLCLLPVPVVELNVEHDGPEDESSGQ